MKVNNASPDFPYWGLFASAVADFISTSAASFSFLLLLSIHLDSHGQLLWKFIIYFDEIGGRVLSYSQIAFCPIGSHHLCGFVVDALAVMFAFIIRSEICRVGGDGTLWGT